MSRRILRRTFEFIKDLRSKVDPFNRNQLFAEFFVATIGFGLAGGSVGMKIPVIKYQVTVEGISGGIPPLVAFCGILIVLCFLLFLSFCREIVLRWDEPPNFQ